MRRGSPRPRGAALAWAKSSTPELSVRRPKSAPHSSSTPELSVRRPKPAPHSSSTPELGVRRTEPAPHFPPFASRPRSRVACVARVRGNLRTRVQGGMGARKAVGIATTFLDPHPLARPRSSRCKASLQASARRGQGAWPRDAEVMGDGHAMLRSWGMGARKAVGIATTFLDPHPLARPRSSRCKASLQASASRGQGAWPRDAEVMGDGRAKLSHGGWPRDAEVMGDGRAKSGWHSNYFPRPAPPCAEVREHGHAKLSHGGWPRDAEVMGDGRAKLSHGGWPRDAEVMGDGRAKSGWHSNYFPRPAPPCTTALVAVQSIAASICTQRSGSMATRC